MQIAITGGTGFVGTALLRALTKQHCQVKALARNPSKIEPARNIEVIEGDLNNTSALHKLIADCDVFIHLAGITHARKREEYFSVNRDAARHLAELIRPTPVKLLHISSLSAREPRLSPYAQSKRESETAVAQILDQDRWLALRLPAIYGDGDLVTLPFFKLVKSGIAPAPSTTPPARASLLYVQDCADAIIAAARFAETGKVYDVGGDREDGHSWEEIATLLGQTLGKTPRKISIPKPVIAAYYAALRRVEEAMGDAPSVREGQVNELFHPDWVARENLLSKAIDWTPAHTLEQGFAKTAIWYQENKLI